MTGRLAARVVNKQMGPIRNAGGGHPRPVRALRALSKGLRIARLGDCLSMKYRLTGRRKRINKENGERVRRYAVAKRGHWSSRQARSEAGTWKKGKEERTEGAKAREGVGKKGVEG